MPKVTKELNHSPAVRGLLKGAIYVSVLLIASGWWLGKNYDVSQIEALRAVWRGGTWESLVAKIHYWSSGIILVTSFLAVLASLLSGDFRVSKVRWYGALVLFFSAYLLQITGNALPMDQHDVRTAAVEAGIAARAPAIGPQLAEAVRGGAAVTTQTIANWAEWHKLYLTGGYVLGLLLILVGMAGKPKETKSGLAIEDLLEFIPFVAAIALPFILSGPTGSLAQSADFNSPTAVPSWYALPLHALLRLGDSVSPDYGWLFFMGLPGLGSLLLLAAPFLFSKMGDGLRRVLVLVGLGGLGAVCFLYGSPIAPITGDQPVTQSSASWDGEESPIDARLAEMGAKVFQKNCIGCHGENAKGGSAPALTRFSTKTSVRQLMEFIKDPESVRKGSVMPPQKSLSEEELKAVAEYVRSPKESAPAKPQEPDEERAKV